MNSLNIISSRVSPTSSPAPSRSNSIGSMSFTVTSEEEREHERASAFAAGEKNAYSAEPDDYHGDSQDGNVHGRTLDERTPLLPSGESKEMGARSPTWQLIPKRIANAFINSIRWVLSTLAAPGVYLIACLYDDNGHFAPFLQLKKLFGVYHGNTRKMAEDYQENAALNEKNVNSSTTGFHSSGNHTLSTRPFISSGSSSSGLSSESESDIGDKGKGIGRSSGQRHSRTKSLQDSEEIAPARRSIRIKLHNDEGLRQRKHRKAQSASARSGGGEGAATGDISAQLKSPTSPVGALTKYPKTPAPPRPLIPRRQPSYINLELNPETPQKTLILDLDETLIHSMSKGGRMSTGHMVEVRLSTTYVAVGGQASIGPQHPILYYVHKRPHCDDFLRRVSKWYNLVVFTASVQEYADPVIDFLESERKYFSGRYYRQHCTFRHGAFIKDLSSIEPDLSKVMILDNSPLSYMFHQDNAIPIQGWINDPTDNDLMHLIPLLEGLQYVSDVRALLALRGGEDGQHMA